jgi:hypothetical protein
VFVSKDFLFASCSIINGVINKGKMYVKKVDSFHFGKQQVLMNEFLIGSQLESELFWASVKSISNTFFIAIFESGSIKKNGFFIF